MFAFLPFTWVKQQGEASENQQRISIFCRPDKRYRCILAMRNELATVISIRWRCNIASSVHTRFSNRVTHLTGYFISLLRVSSSNTITKSFLLPFSLYLTVLPSSLTHTIQPLLTDLLTPRSLTKLEVCETVSHSLSAYQIRLLGARNKTTLA